MYMKRQPVGSLLEAWYGSERAQSEKLRFLPKARPLSEVAMTVLSRAVPPDVLAVAQLKEDWLKIAGPEIAARTEPCRLEGSKLLVEISHPAWLTHFRSPQVKKALLARIREALGRTSCTDIVFIPAGRQAPGA